MKKDSIYVDSTIDKEALAQSANVESKNRPEREEWFMDQAVGLFIHWGLDSPLGTVISHWMIGASDEIQDKFIKAMPALFNPRLFNADDWARFAKLAGFKYVTFTCKHHLGFCMFETKTTDFNVMNTTFGRDVNKELMDAVRKQGLATGSYFSPYDFHWLRNHGIDLHFATPEVLPVNNPGMMEYNRKQLREILGNYGKIDMVFFDGPPTGLKDVVRECDPDTLITRGEMETPEQVMPDQPIPGPWEACYTLGTQWNYKPTNEIYKTGTELIEMLIEIRAKGGNILFNVTADPLGRIPEEQQRLLQEFGTFLFFNGEAIYEVRPWTVTHEGNIWYTKAKDKNTVYAFVTKEQWNHGVRKEFFLKSVKATDETVIELVGQSGKILEHQPDADTETRWHQDEEGLHISALLSYRVYNDRKWPNPIVIRITNAANV
jgi:alpha-L-fucosidase